MARGGPSELPAQPTGNHAHDQAHPHSTDAFFTSRLAEGLRGCALSLDPACHEECAAAPAVVARIVAKGDPGLRHQHPGWKLASVRVAADET